MEKNLIIGIVLIIVPYMLFYLLPIDCWIIHPRPIELGTTCTYGEVIAICNSPMIMNNIFGTSLISGCNFWNNIKFIVWIIMGIGGVMVISYFFRK